ncbi:unnamed protein product [Ixodes hexagonus]
MPQRDVAMFELGLRDYGSSWTRLQEALKVQQQMYGPPNQVHPPPEPKVRSEKAVKEREQEHASQDKSPVPPTSLSDLSDHSAEGSTKAADNKTSARKSRRGLMGLITRKKDSASKKKGAKRDSKSPDSTAKESTEKGTTATISSEEDTEAARRVDAEQAVGQDGTSSKRMSSKYKMAAQVPDANLSTEEAAATKKDKSRSIKSREEYGQTKNGKYDREDFLAEVNSGPPTQGSDYIDFSSSNNRKTSRGDSPPDGRPSCPIQQKEQHHRSNGKLYHEEASKDRSSSPVYDKDVQRRYRRDPSRDDSLKEPPSNGISDNDDQSLDYRRNGEATGELSFRQAIGSIYYQEQSTHPRAKRESSRQQQFSREPDFGNTAYHSSSSERPRQRSREPLPRDKEVSSTDGQAPHRSTREHPRQEPVRDKESMNPTYPRDQQRHYRNSREYSREDTPKEKEAGSFQSPREPASTYNGTSKDLQAANSARERGPASPRYREEEFKYPRSNNDRSSWGNPPTNGDVQESTSPKSRQRYPREFADEDDEFMLAENRQFVPLTGQSSRKPPLVKPATNGEAARPSSWSSPTLGCTRCGDKVYPKEMVTPKPGVLLHSACFKCRECGVKLTLQTFFTNQRDTRDADVYCRTHVPRLGPGTVDGNALSILTSKNSKEIKFSRYGKVSDEQALLSSKVIAQKEEAEGHRGDPMGLRYM